MMPSTRQPCECEFRPRCRRGRCQLLKLALGGGDGPPAVELDGGVQQQQQRQRRRRDLLGWTARILSHNASCDGNLLLWPQHLDHEMTMIGLGVYHAQDGAIRLANGRDYLFPLRYFSGGRCADGQGGAFCRLLALRQSDGQRIATVAFDERVWLQAVAMRC